jgi:penicillin V acylase-like amidase (Ntn superfamily)
MDRLRERVKRTLQRSEWETDEVLRIAAAMPEPGWKGISEWEIEPLDGKFGLKATSHLLLVNSGGYEHERKVVAHISAQKITIQVTHEASARNGCVKPPPAFSKTATYTFALPRDDDAKDKFVRPALDLDKIVGVLRAELNSTA